MKMKAIKSGSIRKLVKNKTESLLWAQEKEFSTTTDVYKAVNNIASLCTKKILNSYSFLNNELVVFYVLSNASI